MGSRRTLAARLARRYAGAEKGFPWVSIRMEQQAEGVWRLAFKHCPAMTDLQSAWEVFHAAEDLIEELTETRKLGLQAGNIAKRGSEAA